MYANNNEFCKRQGKKSVTGTLTTGTQMMYLFCKMQLTVSCKNKHVIIYDQVIFLQGIHSAEKQEI